MKSLIVMMSERLSDVYPEKVQAEIADATDLLAPPLTACAFLEGLPDYSDVEVIFGGWGMPVLDRALLVRLPDLKAVFYAAGTVKSFATDALWGRDVLLSSAAAQNAIPVAEYCLGIILLSLKRVLPYMRMIRDGGGWIGNEDVTGGNYQARVGLVSYGMIARILRDRLKPFDLEVKVCCPFLSSEEAAAEGMELLPLEELFETCDVISVHTPELPETFHLIGSAHLRRMKPGATLVNTARGSICDQQGLVEVLGERTDLTAILDVLEEEPPTAGDPILRMPNVFVTPHLAGATGSERGRLGRFAFQEYQRYANGEPLLGLVREERLQTMA